MVSKLYSEGRVPNRHVLRTLLCPFDIARQKHKGYYRATNGNYDVDGAN